MRYKDIDIPNVSNRFGKRTARERQVNNYTMYNNRVEVHLPVFNYIYSNTDKSLQEQAQHLKEDLLIIQRYLPENSYNRFTIRFKMKSAELDHPKNWRGNLEGVEPEYNDSGNLANKEDFIPESEYTGYDRFRIHERDPDRFGSDEERNPYYMRYDSKFRENLISDIISKARQQNYDWDSRSDVDKVFEWAFKPNQKGRALFLCSAIRTSVVRDVTLDVGNNRAIGQIALNGDYEWGVQVHELGHLLLDLGDYYNISVENGQVGFNDAGYLGNTSIMGKGLWRDIHFAAFSKFRVDWLDPEIIEPDFVSKEFELHPVYASDQNAILIRPNKHQKPGEFFLLEYRTRNGQDSKGRPIEFDQQLGADLEDGVVVYHINTTNAKGGRHDVAEPMLDVEGEPFNTTEIVAMHEGDRFDHEQSRFYGNHQSGLRIDFLGTQPDGAHKVKVTWNIQPNLDAVASFPDDRIHIVGRGSDSTPLYKVFNGRNHDEDWYSLGGGCINRPSISRDKDNITVVCRGNSSRPFYKKQVDGKWSPGSRRWTLLGGGVTHEPFRARWGASNVIIVRGRSGRVFMKLERSDSWKPGLRRWQKLNDTVVNGRPTAIGTKSLGLHLFASDEDGTPIHCVVTDFDRRDYRWSSLGGRVSSDIYGSHDFDNDHIDIFARGISGKIFHKQFNGSDWLPGSETWNDLGGLCRGPVSVTRLKNGEIHLVITGISGRVFHKYQKNNSWSDWDNLGGQTIDTPIAVARHTIEDRLDLFTTGISGRAFHKWWDGRQWNPGQTEWKSLGGSFL